MKIWKLKFEVDLYDNLIPKETFSTEEIQSFDGRSKLSNWKPIEVTRMEPEKNIQLGDAPGFFLPVFSKKAVEILKPLIQNYVEFLPLIFEEKYYVINVVNVLDAIDYDLSEYKTFRDGKRIMAFKKYCFKVEAIGENHIFKIIDEKRRGAFVTDKFKSIVEKNNLNGFKFELVWDSERE